MRNALADTTSVIWMSVAFFVFSLFLFTRLGQEFIPTLDEKNLAMHAMRIPSLTSLSQSQDMQLKVEATVRAFPEVAFVFSKTGTAEMASDPMPPHVSDTFIILKPQSDWPDPSMTKAELVEKIAAAVGLLPGNNYEYTQPIQMRFNELIAGVRSDVAVKVFGDDFDELGTTATKVASVLRQVPGAADVKVEQTTGLPMLDVKLDKQAISRYGLNIGDVLDVISIAVGGGEAGLVFQGDRRFAILVRLPDHLRDNLETLENLPVPVPDTDGDGAKTSFIPLKTLRGLWSRKARTRSAAKTASAAWSFRRTCAGVTSALLSKRRSVALIPRFRCLQATGWPGRAVRKPASGPQPVDDRRTGVLLHHLPDAIHRIRQSARGTTGVLRRAARDFRRYLDALSP